MCVMSAARGASLLHAASILFLPPSAALSLAIAVEDVSWLHQPRVFEHQAMQCRQVAISEFGIAVVRLPVFHCFFAPACAILGPLTLPSLNRTRLPSL